MSPDDRTEALGESVSEGQPVDWGRAEGGAASAGERAKIRGFRDLERIAAYHRRLQRGTATPANAPRGVTAPEQWGHLTLLERTSAGASGEVWRGLAGRVPGE